MPCAVDGCKRRPLGSTLGRPKCPCRSRDRSVGSRNRKWGLRGRHGQPRHGRTDGRGSDRLAARRTPETDADCPPRPLDSGPLHGFAWKLPLTAILSWREAIWRRSAHPRRRCARRRRSVHDDATLSAGRGDATHSAGQTGVSPRLASDSYFTAAPCMQKGEKVGGVFSG